MAINFPNSPSDGTIYTPAGGPTYVYTGGLWKFQGTTAAASIIGDGPPSSPTVGQLWWESDTGNLFVWYNDGDSSQWVQVSGTVASMATAQTKNRIVNGAMQHSQENGNTAAASATSGQYYPADQWFVAWSTTGTISSTRVNNTAIASQYHINTSATTATASPAAGAYWEVRQRIEGTRVSDFMWGTASAKQIVVRFSVVANVTGTFSLYVGNSAFDRTYLAPFTIATANVWQTFTFVIPGDTTGTWLKDTGIGLQVGIGLCTGTALGGGVAGWQAGTRLQIAGNTNLAAAAGNSISFTDFGLYLDDTSSGVAPRWEMPDAAQELAACLRYWSRIDPGNTGDGYAKYGQGGQTFAFMGRIAYKFPMRITPAGAYSGSVTAQNCSALGIATYADAAITHATVTATGTYYCNNAVYTLNARM